MGNNRSNATGKFATPFGEVEYEIYDQDIRFEVHLCLVTTYRDQVIEIKRAMHLYDENSWSLLTARVLSKTLHVVPGKRPIDIVPTSEQSLAYLPPGVAAKDVKDMINAVRKGWVAHATAHPEIAKDIWRRHIERVSIHVNSEVSVLGYKLKAAKFQAELVKGALEAENTYAEWCKVCRRGHTNVYDIEFVDQKESE